MKAFENLDPRHILRPRILTELIIELVDITWQNNNKGFYFYFFNTYKVGIDWCIDLTVIGLRSMTLRLECYVALTTN